jgi:hypothetical protein
MRHLFLLYLLSPGATLKPELAFQLCAPTASAELRIQLITVAKRQQIFSGQKNKHLEQPLCFLIITRANTQFLEVMWVRFSTEETDWNAHTKS